jgi:hypothetical protein
MPTEFSVDFSEEAQEALRGMGFLTRRLLRQAVRDELRTEDPSLPVFDEAGGKVLEIGDYRVFFRSETEDDRRTVRYVDSIVPTGEAAGDTETVLGRQVAPPGR